MCDGTDGPIVDRILGTMDAQLRHVTAVTPELIVNACAHRLFQWPDSDVLGLCDGWLDDAELARLESLFGEGLGPQGEDDEYEPYDETAIEE